LIQFSRTKYGQNSLSAILTLLHAYRLTDGRTETFHLALLSVPKAPATNCRRVVS